MTVPTYATRLTAKQCDTLDCVVSWPGIASSAIATELDSSGGSTRRLVKILAELGLVNVGECRVIDHDPADIAVHLRRVLEEVIDRQSQGKATTVDDISAAIGSTWRHVANCLSKLRISGHIGPAWGVYPTDRGVRVAMAYRGVSVAFTGA